MYTYIYHLIIHDDDIIDDNDNDNYGNEDNDNDNVTKFKDPDVHKVERWIREQR